MTPLNCTQPNLSFFYPSVSSLSLLLCYPCDDSLLTPDVNAKKHRFTKQETDKIAVKLHKKCVIDAENTVVVQPKGQGLVNALLLSDVEEEWPWCLELKETETNFFFYLPSSRKNLEAPHQFRTIRNEGFELVLRSRILYSRVSNECKQRDSSAG